MSDAEYLEIALAPIRACADYRPNFGRGRGGGCDLAQFREMYRADAFYSWFGMDDPLVYAAHKAAGGMTSIYRQIGIGGERLVRKIICDHLGVPEARAVWSYQSPGGRTLSLDARIAPADIADAAARKRVRQWLRRAAAALDVKPKPEGAVFEIRQGYKSKDSKRQNADIANAAAALSRALLPCALVLSVQMDADLARRYRAAKWLVLTGELQGGALVSSYDFMREVAGYDLAAFFARNRRRLRAETRAVLRALLSAQ